jgi:hypothetical protein
VGDESTAVHEAGHLTVAACLGWKLHGGSITSGRVFVGCARFTPPVLAEGVWDRGLRALAAGRPLVCWPGPVREQLEQRLMITLAGDVARLSLAPTVAPARVAEGAAGLAADLAASLPDVEPADLAAFQAAVDDPGDTDEEKAARMARLACGEDLASAAALLAWCEAQARFLIGAQAGAVTRLARALALRESLSGAAAAAVLGELQGPGVD